MNKYLLLFVLSISAICFYSCFKNDIETPVASSTDEFIKYTVNGTDYSFIMPVDSVFSSPDSVENAQFNWYIGVRANRIPNSPTDLASIGYAQSGIAQGSTQLLKFFYTVQTGIFPYMATSANPILVTINEYGIPGEYVAGNFSGLFIGPPPVNTQYNVVCNFRFKRRI